MIQRPCASGEVASESRVDGHRAGAFKASSNPRGRPHDNPASRGISPNVPCPMVPVQPRRHASAQPLHLSRPDRLARRPLRHPARSPRAAAIHPGPAPIWTARVIESDSPLRDLHLGSPVQRLASPCLRASADPGPTILDSSADLRPPCEPTPGISPRGKEKGRFLWHKWSCRRPPTRNRKRRPPRLGGFFALDWICVGPRGSPRGEAHGRAGSP